MVITAMFFNATLEELSRSGESLENLAAVKGGGYSATIGVYHELHCLVGYPDTYLKRQYSQIAAATQILSLS